MGGVFITPRPFCVVMEYQRRLLLREIKHRLASVEISLYYAALVVRL